MKIKYKDDLKNIDWQELAEVYERAPLAKREPEQLKKAFKKSYFTCIALYEGKPIAAGRIISDGEYYANIYDVVVLPEYQGKGIGKQIMNLLLEKVSTFSCHLTTTLGKEDFYYKLGFRKHKTAMSVYPPSKRDSARKYLEE